MRNWLWTWLDHVWVFTCTRRWENPMANPLRIALILSSALSFPDLGNLWRLNSDHFRAFPFRQAQDRHLPTEKQTMQTSAMMSYGFLWLNLFDVFKSSSLMFFASETHSNLMVAKRGRTKNETHKLLQNIKLVTYSTLRQEFKKLLETVNQAYNILPPNPEWLNPYMSGMFNCVVRSPALGVAHSRRSNGYRATDGKPTDQMVCNTNKINEIGGWSDTFKYKQWYCASWRLTLNGQQNVCSKMQQVSIMGYQ